MQKILTWRWKEVPIELAREAVTCSQVSDGKNDPILFIFSCIIVLTCLMMLCSYLLVFSVLLVETDTDIVPVSVCTYRSEFI